MLAPYIRFVGVAGGPPASSIIPLISHYRRKLAESTMQILRQSTSQAIRFGPFVDSTDGVTAETALTIANTDIQLSKDGAAFGAKNSGGGTHDADGWYSATLDATDTGTVGVFIAQIAVSGALPVYVTYHIVEEAVYDAMYGDGAAGPTVSGVTVNADVLSISGDTTAADNLELQYDGTGYTDDTAPASRSQVSNIGASSGGSINIAAGDDNSTGGTVDPASTAFVGTITANTIADTQSANGVAHEMDDAGNDIDIVYQFTLAGNQTANAVDIVANVNGNTDDMDISAYDHIGTAWEKVGTLEGVGGADYKSISPSLLQKHVGTGAEMGNVYIRMHSSVGSTPASLQVDKILIQAVTISQSVGYAMGAIWIDTTASNTTTENYVDGVADNPVSTWAAAKTLSSQLGIKKFQLAAGSSITLDASAVNHWFSGQAYSVDLGGQDIDGAFFFGANVSGTGTAGSANHPVFEDCPVGTVTLPPSIMRRCYLSGTITNSTTGSWFINHCMSRVAGAGSPVFDFGNGVGATNLNMRLYSGGIQLDYMTALDTASIEGFGNVIEDSTCTGGAVSCRGLMTATDITNITMSDNARLDTDQINAQADLALTDATNVSANIEQIGGSATSASNLAASALGIISTTVNDAGASTTAFVISSSEATDDHFIGRIIVFTSGALAGQATDITDYVGSTKTVTVTALTEAPANGVSFVIV